MNQDDYDNFDYCWIVLGTYGFISFFFLIMAFVFATMSAPKF